MTLAQRARAIMLASLVLTGAACTPDTQSTTNPAPDSDTAEQAQASPSQADQPKLDQPKLDQPKLETDVAVITDNTREAAAAEAQRLLEEKLEEEAARSGATD